MITGTFLPNPFSAQKIVFSKKAMTKGRDTQLDILLDKQNI